MARISQRLYPTRDVIPEFRAKHGRGRYDRSRTPAERAAQQAIRIADATAAVVAQRGLTEATIDHVVRAAGVGRNTFYRHYRDLDHAVRRVRATAGATLWRKASAGLAAAYTPTEKIRSIVRVWLDLAKTDPNTVTVLLLPTMTDAGSAPSEATVALGQLLTATLADAHRDAVLSTPPDPIRVLAATGALEAVARDCLRQPGSLSVAESTLVDVIVRLFR